MDLDRLEAIGLEPLKTLLRQLGGWPVLEGQSWNEAGFQWDETTYEFRKQGYSTDYLFDFSISTDIRNSSWRVIYFDQASLGLRREYFVKGLEDQNVQHYYNYMQRVRRTPRSIA